MRFTCVICKHHFNSEPVLIWVYSHRAGGDKSYQVCSSCAAHTKHAEHIVTEINRKNDHDAGYKNV